MNNVVLTIPQTTPAILAGIAGLRAQHIDPTGQALQAYWRT